MIKAKSPPPKARQDNQPPSETVSGSNRLSLNRASSAAVGPPWVSAAAAISWIATRDFEADWNRAYYPGACLAPILDPAWVSEWLGTLWSADELETPPHSPFLKCFTPCIYAEARRIEGLGSDWLPSERALLEAAQLFAEQLRNARAETDEHFARLTEAADSLRLAIADGHLDAFGRPGSPPSEDEPEATESARLPIPPADCKAPVTLCRLGIASVIPGDPVRDGWRLLWHDIRLGRSDLLRLWPENTQDAKLNLSVAVSPTRPPASISDDDLGAWFEERVANWDPACRFPSEGDDHTAANAYFPQGIPREQLRRVRREKTPEKWRKSGPRKLP